MLDVFGDFGGLLEVLKILCSFFLAPWTQFKLGIKLIQKLYLVRTKDNDLFRETKSKKHLEKIAKIRSATSKGVGNIRIAKLRVCDQICLFVKELMPSCCTEDRPEHVKNKL